MFFLPIVAELQSAAEVDVHAQADIESRIYEVDGKQFELRVRGYLDKVFGQTPPSLSDFIKFEGYGQRKEEVFEELTCLNRSQSNEGECPDKLRSTRIENAVNEESLFYRELRRLLGSCFAQSNGESIQILSKRNSRVQQARVSFKGCQEILTLDANPPAGTSRETEGPSLTEISGKPSTEWILEKTSRF